MRCAYVLAEQRNTNNDKELDIVSLSFTQAAFKDERVTHHRNLNHLFGL